MYRQNTGIKAISIALLVAINFCMVPMVSAAGALTNLSDTMSRQSDSTPTTITSDHVLKFTTPTGLLTGGYKIQVDFPVGFVTTGVLFSDMTVKWGPSTGLENTLTIGSAAPSGATWQALFTGQQLNITSGTGTIAAGSKVVITIAGTNKITNPATAGTYLISMGIYTGATPIDTGKVAVVINSDDSFVVAASVDPSLTFTLDTTLMNFGILTSTGVTTASSFNTSNAYVRLTTSTNADSGYSISVKDVGSAGGGGLYNSTADFTIGSSNYTYGATQDLSAAAGYGLQATSASETVAVPYTSAGTTVGKIQKTFQALSTYASPASANTVDLTLKAKITGATPAGSYTDTLTVLVTPNF